MKLEELELNYKEMGEEIEKLKNSDKVWKPEYGEDYFWVCNYGDIVHTLWENDRGDKNFYKIGNCYKTKEEAEFAKEKKIVEIELQRYSDIHDGDKISWKNNSDKHYLYYDFEDEEIYTIYEDHTKTQGVIYFYREEIAKYAVKEIGEDRIKKYIFGVED